MSLLTTIRNAAAVAHSVVSSLEDVVTYHSAGEILYDPSTGTHTDAGADYSLRVLYDAYTHQEIDDDHIKPGDEKCMFPAVNLAVAPKVGDKITKSDGTVCEVVFVRTDPAQAEYILQIRVK